MLDAGGARRLGDGMGTEGLHRAKGLAAAFVQDADEVHDRIRILDRAVDRPAIAQIGLDRHDLADRAERLQMAGEIGPADRDAHAPAVPRQRAHRMAADESGPAEDRDQLSAMRRHDRLRSFKAFLSAQSRAVKTAGGRASMAFSGSGDRPA